MVPNLFLSRTFCKSVYNLLDDPPSHPPYFMDKKPGLQVRFILDWEINRAFLIFSNFKKAYHRIAINYIEKEQKTI